MGMPFLTAVFALSARHVWRMLLCSLLLLTGCSQLLDTQTQAPVSSSHPGKGEQTAGGHDAVSGVTYDLRPLGTRMAEAFLKSSAKTELNAAPGAVLLVAPLAQRADGIDGEAVTTALMARLNSAGIVLADTRQVAALRQQLEYRSAEGEPATASLVRLGKQSGASHMLYGQLTPASANRSHRFTLTMTLMALASGELIWHKQRTMTVQPARTAQ